MLEIEAFVFHSLSVRVTSEDLGDASVTDVKEFTPADVCEEISLEEFVANIGSLAPRVTLKLHYWLSVKVTATTTQLKTTATLNSSTF